MSETVPPALGLVLDGRFQLQQEIGRGATATVFHAFDHNDGRGVAVKVLDPRLEQVLGAGRFLREVEILSRLQHPAILPLLASGKDGGFLYYALKLKIAPREDSPMATFRYSISYLMALFSFLLIDHYLPVVWPA